MCVHSCIPKWNTCSYTYTLSKLQRCVNTCTCTITHKLYKSCTKWTIIIIATILLYKCSYTSVNHWRDGDNLQPSAKAKKDQDRKKGLIYICRRQITGLANQLPSSELLAQRQEACTRYSVLAFTRVHDLIGHATSDNIQNLTLTWRCDKINFLCSIPHANNEPDHELLPSLHVGKKDTWWNVWSLGVSPVAVELLCDWWRPSWLKCLTYCPCLLCSCSVTTKFIQHRSRSLHHITSMNV